MANQWKYALASVTGISHLKNDGECQDASVSQILAGVDGEPILVAVASDGAGSARLSAEGSHLACSLFVREMQTFFESGGRIELITASLISDWLQYFQAETNALAEISGASIRDYACTFLAAIIGINDSVFVQIGDGAIVISVADEPNEYNYVYWPQKGEYENMTFFATDVNASKQLEFGYQKGVIEEVAVFTDGIQRLALDFSLQVPHNPFFRPMFAPLRSADAAEDGTCVVLSKALQQYLASDTINDRTDDDKTLILATRRLPAA